MKVFSIIVCYHPNVQNLRQLCSTLKQSHSTVIIVDNSENHSIAEREYFSGFTLIPMKNNVGIARAQNIGIQHAIQNGADFIAFFDQDSKIDNDFLPSLLAPLEIGIPRIVAPVFYDDAQGYEFPSFRLTKCGYPIKVYKQGRSMPYDVDVITSSGSAATAVTFDIAGLMDEDYFIDLVDTEWCLRCRSKNIPIQVVPAAVMKHSVGKASIDYWLMRGFVHNPTRCYYQIRNCLLLFRKAHVPFLFALKETFSGFLHQTLLILSVENRWEYMRNCSRAVSHGIRGIVGKLPT